MDKAFGPIMQTFVQEIHPPCFLRPSHKTYPTDCRKKAAVDSNKHDWNWKNRGYWKKKIFEQKHFLSPIYSDGIS